MLMAPLTDLKYKYLYSDSAADKERGKRSSRVAEGARANSPDGGDHRRRLQTIHTGRVGGKCYCAVRLLAGIRQTPQP